MKQTTGLPHVDVLLITATPIETRAVVAAVALATGGREPVRRNGYRAYSYLGDIGGAAVALVETEAGTSTPGGAIASLVLVLKELKPSTALMVGIAFGISKNQSIGTVIVAKQVVQYEVTRVGTGPDGQPEIVERGVRVPSSPAVLSKLKATLREAPFPHDDGLFLSGDKLVDNLELRSALHARFPEAKAGDMEMSGLALAAQELNVAWGAAKSICDWADGKKGVEKAVRQDLAAKNAATFIVEAVLQGGFGSSGAPPGGGDGELRLSTQTQEDERIGKLAVDESHGRRNTSQPAEREAGLNAVPELPNRRSGELGEFTAPNDRIPPPPTDVFIGRDDELRELNRAFSVGRESGEPSVVAIHGMPGIGKSYLASYFGENSRGLFPGGARRLRLGVPEQRTEHELLDELARQQNVAPSGLAASLESSGSVIIVENIDNDENARLAAALANRLQGTSMIFTGRVEELGRAAGWKQVPLRPLEARDGARMLAILADDAELADREDFRELAKYLGYLPLALYLAAGQLRRGLLPAQVIELLEKRRIALEPVDRTDPRLLAEATRAILDASIHLSWELFSGCVGGDAALLITRVGTLQTLEFGNALGACLAETSESEFAFAMARAVGLSIFSCATRGRWTVHPVIASFLRDRCDRMRAAELNQTWFAKQLSGWQPGRTPDEEPVERELSNLSFTLRDMENSTLRDWVSDFFVFAQTRGPFAGWASAIVSGNEDTWPEGVRVKAAFLLRLGSRLEAAERMARDVADSSSSVAVEGEALRVVGDILAQRGDTDEAMKVRKQEIRCFEEEGMDLAVAAANGRLAELLARIGEAKKALQIYEDIELPAYRLHGLAREESIVLGKIGALHRSAGDHSAASAVFKDREKAAIALGDPREFAVARCDTATTQLLEGNPKAAEETARECIDVFTEIEDERQVALAYHVVARSQIAQGDGGGGMETLDTEVVPRYRSCGLRRDVAFACADKAGVLLKSGEESEALRILTGEVIPVFLSTGDDKEYRENQVLAALLLLEAGKIEDGRTRLQLAMSTNGGLSPLLMSQIRALAGRFGVDLASLTR